MAAQPTGFCIDTRDGGRRLRVGIPARVFAPAAEELRWQALRAGHLGLEDWHQVEAFVSPRFEGKPEPEEGFQFAITIFGAQRPVRQYYAPDRLQGLGLFVQLRLERLVGTSPARRELHWLGAETHRGHRVPLAPRRPPLSSLPTTRSTGVDPEPVLVRFSEMAKEGLAMLSNDSLRARTELGGCLLGRMPDPDTVFVERLHRAPASDASVAHFCFDSRFWLDVGTQLDRHPTLSVVGWAHSHLLDEGGPLTLSVRDLIVLHNYFRAPWSVAALVCSSSKSSELRRFGWCDGNVVALDEERA
jgi:hypothetical protein